MDKKKKNSTKLSETEKEMLSIEIPPDIFPRIRLVAYCETVTSEVRKTRKWWGVPPLPKKES